MKKQILIAGLVCATTLSFGQWGLNGNSISSTNFLGSTNLQPVVFKVNNQEVIRATTGNFVGIGIASPLHKLSVAGNIAFNTNLVSRTADANIYWGNGSSGDLKFRTASALEVLASYNDRMTIKNDGKVGIGTTVPAQQLEVYTTATNGGVQITQNGNGAAGLWLNNTTTGGRNWLVGSAGVNNNSEGPGSYFIYDISANANRFVIKGGSGFIGIGTNNPLFMLDVSGAVRIGTTKSTVHANALLTVGGKIVCQDFYVTALGDWADFVFENNYQLPNLNDVKTYYTTNKHLPGVPSANEISEKGINLGEMSKIQMQKIEELTIYLVQMKEEIELLKKENEEFKKLQIK